MAKTKRQLRETFFQKCPECCDNYSLRLIKELIKGRTFRKDDAPLAEALENSGIDLDDFADKLLENMRHNWFDLYYFDIVLQHFKTLDIKNCIEKDRYELRKFIRHIIWCRIKEQKINRVDNFTTDDISMVFRLYSEVERQLSSLLEIKFSHSANVGGYAQDDDFTENLKEYLEDNFKETITGIIWDCLKIDKEDKDKKKEGYQHLCCNIKDNLWKLSSNISHEIREKNKKFVNSTTQVEFSLPDGNSRHRILLAFVFLIIIERLVYIRLHIRKYGTFVYAIKSKDNEFYNCLYTGGKSHPACNVNLKHLIHAITSRYEFNYETEEDIIQEIITSLVLGKIDEYRFVQSLKSYIYMLLKSYVNRRIKEITKNDSMDENYKSSINDPVEENKSLFETIQESSILKETFEVFQKNIDTFIERASRQRKSIVLKKRILFDSVTDQELYEEYKDHDDPMYKLNNIKNIKTIRSRIRSSLREKSEWLKEGNGEIKSVTIIIADHLKKIEREASNELSRAVQLLYLNKILLQFRSLFGNTSFAAHFFEELMKEVMDTFPAVGEYKKIILREFKKLYNRG